MKGNILVLVTLGVLAGPIDATARPASSQGVGALDYQRGELETYTQVSARAKTSVPSADGQPSSSTAEWAADLVTPDIDVSVASRAIALSLLALVAIRARRKRLARV